MKKAIAITLALTLCLTLLPMTVLAVTQMPSAYAASGWMSECKPYQYTEVTEYLPEDGKTFAIGGQDYNEGYVFYLWNAARTSQVLYNLKGEYSSFTFYAGHVDGTNQYTAQLEIYLDGTLSETVTLTPYDIAKEVTIDTDGIKSLKIAMTSDEELNHYDITYGIYGGTFTRNGTTADAIPNSNMVGNCEPYEFVGEKDNKVIRSAENQEIYMGGDAYTDCLQFYLWNPYRESQAKFNFGGKFESMSFVLGHIDGTSRYPVTFEFTADGKVIETVNVEPDDLPIPVTLSLSGVKQLIITMTSSQAANTYYYYYGLGAIQLEGVFEFDDVPDDDYYFDAVTWAVKNGITTGATSTTFEPESDCTRAQIVTFLWRAMGRPEPKSAVNPFTDLDENEYYYKAVLWAVENGITTGATTTTFEPEETCTRAQAVTFLWRADGKPSASGESGFTDVEMGSFYETAVLWAVEQGITTGTDPGVFSPEEECTRAQIVTFLWRDLA